MLASTWSAMDCRASRGIRIRMAETTEMWLNFTLDIQGLFSLLLRRINSSMEDWYMVSLGSSSS